MDGGPRLAAARGWVQQHARTVAQVVLAGLASSLLRDGISALSS